MDTNRWHDIENEASRHFEFFRERGACRVETGVLLDASAMLDLYGEDIRARAYVIDDPIAGALMMRPDYTVPTAQIHLNAGVEAAEYTYAGPVFRKQLFASGRAREYMQVGYENFGRQDIVQTDALVLGLFSEALDLLDLRLETGDMGVVIDAVESLSTTPRRKSNLLRHIWHPRRFRELLGIYRSSSQDTEVIPHDEVDGCTDSVLERIAAAGPQIGMRGMSEIRDRLASLKEDSAAPPLDPQEATALDNVLEIDGTMEEALDRIRECGCILRHLGAAVDRMERRMDAISELGIESGGIRFRTIFGQTTLEYYDGFVFGFFSRNDALPPVATGGRYNLLTRMLSGGRDCPGVGGAIRPEVVLQIREKQCQ